MTAALSCTEKNMFSAYIYKGEEFANHCLIFIYEGFRPHHAHINGPGKGLPHEPKVPEKFYA